MSTQIDVPYEEKDLARALGAWWDPIAMTWYAPHDEPALLACWYHPPLTELPGEDRHFGGEELFVDLIPRSCFYKNVRSNTAQRDWEGLRQLVCRRCQNTCECCGATGFMEVHERWEFDEVNHVQTLKRLIGLCPACYLSTHMGYARVNHREDEATSHLRKVTGMTEEECRGHIKAAFVQWRERNQFDWRVDLSILEKAGIGVVRPTH